MKSFCLSLALGCLSLNMSCLAFAFGCADFPFLQFEDAINLYCLRAFYPQAGALEKDAAGNKWLLLPNGRVLYSGSQQTDLRQSLATPYPLEPARPDTPPGFSPGRIRAEDFFKKIYGNDQTAVRKNLGSAPWLFGRMSLAPAAARALAQVTEELAPARGALKDWLLPGGSFNWRRIAGENALSAHSFGIALDIGVKKAPYWRWNRQMPHPLQKAYPGEIVAAFERNGFIWGGKWHEYDLMHYEYRPEIICKARLREIMAKTAKKSPQSPVRRP